MQQMREDAKLASQDFNILSLLPSPYSVAAAAVAPAALSQTKGLLGNYGLLGEFVRVAGVGTVVAGSV